MDTDYAVIGNGCFWCTEAIFKKIIGVKFVTSGYTGGYVINPSYEQVCSGKTGHVECIRIVFNPKKVSYSDLLEISFATHDPTQLNKQGNDKGMLYRSVIFFNSIKQKKEAEVALKKAQKEHKEIIVTTIEPLKEWYEAESYHQRYWEKHGRNNFYCAVTIPPKIEKLYKKFSTKVKR